MDKNTIKTIFKLAVAIVFLCFGLANITSIFGIFGSLIGLISPFLVGACIAFILNVPMKVWEVKVLKCMQNKQSGKRVISILLTLISVGLVLFVVIWMVVPQLIDAGESIAEKIPAAWENARAFVNENVEADTQIGVMITQISANGEKLIAELTDYLKNSSGHILSTTVDVVSGTVDVLVNLFLGLIFAIYILAQKEKLLNQMKLVIRAFAPDKISAGIFEVCSLTQETFQRFITGQCLESVILGTIFFISMSIFRMPYALPISVLIMLTALVPVFGAFIGCIVGAVMILVVSPVQALAFIILFLVLQQLEGNLIYPHVVGNSVGLPSIWVFVAVLTGGKLFGVVGMLVFIPICSVVYVLFRDEVKKRLTKKATVAKKN